MSENREDGITLYMLGQQYGGSARRPVESLARIDPPALDSREIALDEEKRNGARD